ncbi:hypothetical protein L207DRAFT_506575 [Hyaloscypha variabilis F]|uniref:Uncharacterized protein n=1 Tax=Hyaloscypha variabilis (strain UAMH 11265 / GT02V1 / F) TaxID=1149755 RepID=A0A2J6S9Z4_HYAVF|nr:hypothetical protein L207DRAFT_506575 [Hyaloscypha variabilis F]
MAQVAVAPVATNGGTLSAEELREILEYERIVQFRDAVMAGTHPRIKIPPHLLAKQNSSTHVPSPNHPTPRANLPAHPTAGTSSHFEGSPSVYNKSPNNQRSAGGAHVPMSSKAEINPILLEKSDDLIKAEIQLQRQRIERALREQLEQQRLAAKALLQTSESLPNFDISEVLSKALAIVHPSTAAEEASGGAHSSASDSFDENTFYSSQHDTPEPSSPSAGQKEPFEVQSHGVVSVGERPTGQISAQGYVGDQDVVLTGVSLSHDNQNATPRRSQLQHSPSSQKARASIRHDQHSDMGKSDSSDSRVLNAEESSAEQGTQSQVQRPTRDLLQRAFDNPPASPLMRAHNLSPIAPQPARVSPLATARDPPILREPAAMDEAQPAQVAALRNNPPHLSSTDSSPNRAKGPEKKKEKKKKKRKAKDAVEIADTPDSPYIKPEPRSPSPYGVAPLPRPQKRQRQSGQFAAGLNYDEPRQDPQGEPPERLPERIQEVRAPRAYGGHEDRYELEFHRPEPVYRRIEREDDEYRRVDSGQYARRPQSPATYALPYGPNEVRTVRAASQAIIDRRAPEEARYHPVRASVRPDADRERSRSPIMHERRSPVAMATSRQTMRIVMDEFGRKYYEPIPTPVIRHSVAPIRYRDSELIYERAPVRTVSNRIPIEYEEDGVVYRRPASPIAVPRRVVTQPEYAMPAQPEYRSYRQREYSVRPTAMAPPADEYLQVRDAPRRQMSHFEEAPREYIQRAPSARPEAVRYEIPREYTGRLQSVRPEPPPREYASSVRPEARREVIPQSQREFSLRPMDTIPRRQVPVVDDGRYYEEVPSRRPAEIAFIERPRARESSVLVYADDVRREVYR